MNSNLALCNLSYGILEKTTLTSQAKKEQLVYETAQQIAKNAVENNALRIRKEIKNIKAIRIQELHEKISRSINIKDKYGKTPLDILH